MCCALMKLHPFRQFRNAGVCPDFRQSVDDRKNAFENLNLVRRRVRLMTWHRFAPYENEAGLSRAFTVDEFLSSVYLFANLVSGTEFHIVKHIGGGSSMTKIALCLVSIALLAAPAFPHAVAVA